MNQSESIKSLLEALVNAQAEFKTLPKDKDGYGYKYTDLDTVISTVRPILTKNKIGFMQTLTNVNGRDGLTTRVFNVTGEWIEDTFLLPVVAMAKTNAAQNVGAAITYMKRYALCAVLGISSDEDTDAGIPQQQNNQQQSAPKKQTQNNMPKGGPDTPEQRKEINTLVGSTYKDGSKIFSKKEIDGLLTLRLNQTAGEVIEELKKTIAERRAGKEAAEPKQQEFPEDIPYDESPLTPDEEAAANTAFEKK